MKLFAPDLYRNFAIGFVAGAAILGFARFEDWSDQISPPAQASERMEAPAPSGDFWKLAE